MKQPIRVITVADSDSYVKWGGALLAQMPADWDRSLLVLASPVLPSGEQLAAAFAVSDPGIGRPMVVDLAALAVRIAEEQPDVVLLSLRGPLVAVAVRAIVVAAPRRPVLVTGLPGISVPATRLTIAHRTQADLFVLHSRREVREFSELALRMKVDQDFALATFPFLPHRTPGHRADGDVIFAAQATVPWGKADRLALLGWLAEAARRHPYRRVIITVRAALGEKQTNAETDDYARLIAQLKPRAPSNLVVDGGAMADHLVRAAALVTVSSTAAIEAVSLEVPVLAIDDFGMSSGLINTVFDGSGLFGNNADLVEGRFKHANAEWLDDNYFHGVGNDDWVARIVELLEMREAGQLPLKPLKWSSFGGGLRRAWDRKRALGRFDRSLGGALAFVLGSPALLALVSGRRVRALISRRPA